MVSKNTIYLCSGLTARTLTRQISMPKPSPTARWARFTARRATIPPASRVTSSPSN